MCRLSCVVAFLLAVAMPATAEPPTVTLSVLDRLGVERHVEPVCFGVPFARGQLPAGTAMYVEGPEGQSIPTQTKELGWWPDGSVKRLLVQFPADCAPNAEEQYRLVPAATSSTTRGMRVSCFTDAAGIAITTISPWRATNTSSTWT